MLRKGSGGTVCRVRHFHISIRNAFNRFVDILAESLIDEAKRYLLIYFPFNVDKRQRQTRDYQKLSYWQSCCSFPCLNPIEDSKNSIKSLSETIQRAFKVYGVKVMNEVNLKGILF